MNFVVLAATNLRRHYPVYVVLDEHDERNESAVIEYPWTEEGKRAAEQEAAGLNSEVLCD